VPKVPLFYFISKIKQCYSFAVFAVFVGRTNCVNGNLRLQFITMLREVPSCI